MSNSVSRETANALPEQIARVSEVMSTFPGVWCLCGGWAVDAWLGQLTRDHGDLDVNVFIESMDDLYQHLSGSQMVAHDEGPDGGGSSAEWECRPLTLPAHVHCRAPEQRGEIPEDGILTTEMGWWLEINFNNRADDGWVLNSEHGVVLPLDQAIATSRWGLPTAVPEVLLFFKATAYSGTRNYLRRRDHLDFERMVPTLSREKKSWLREAIGTVEPGHPWLGILAM